MASAKTILWKGNHPGRILAGFLCLLIFHTVAYSQETHLEGITLNRTLPVQDVLVKNLSSKRTTTSDEKGFFKIRTQAGDSLVISHLSMKDSVFVVEHSHLKEQPFTFELNDKMIELAEVEINTFRDINAVSLGIIPKKTEKLTLNEKRLYTAGDFKWIHLLSLLGGSLEVDPIINKITGRTKMIKRHIELDKKEATVHWLERQYSDYMFKELGVTEERIGAFLYYLADQPSIQNLIDQKEDNKLKFFILDWWNKFKEQLKDDLPGEN